LEEIAQHLESDPSSLNDDLATVKDFHAQITGQLADVGVRYQRTESLRQTATDAGLTLRASLSSIEDVDVPAAIMEMELANMAYQAALGATAKVIQPTLLDFLR
jgi:flagellar hook-associated protein 3 FlgL